MAHATIFPTVRSCIPPVACLLVSASVLGCSQDWQPLFDEQAAPHQEGRVEIAATTEALTFARFHGDDGPHLLAVTRYDLYNVQGIDLSEALGYVDPITAYNELGYDALVDIIASAPASTRVPVDRLGLPVDLHRHHIAAGTNFPEHADEAGVSGGPYLFPKLVTPTPFAEDVRAGQALLDYEVELAWVPLSDLRGGDSSANFGLILCNDYTDRETLLRLVNTDNVASGDGFTTAKSFPGFLPVGNLFVIPRDHRTFTAGIELKLYVNRELRQREFVARAVWQVEDLVAETWARQDLTWDHRGEPVSLFQSTEREISQRTMLLSGTPPGVVFNELGIEHKASGFFDWLGFGWGESIPDHAIDNYIRDARSAGNYLHPGDEVLIHVGKLGVVHNTIVP